MNKTDRILPRERIYLMNEIAKRDKQLTEQKREIDHYKRQYEIAVRRKLKERHDRTERRKDIITLAVLIIAGAYGVILACNAIQQTLLWASGM